jgi:hypothetical protein
VVSSIGESTRSSTYSQILPTLCGKPASMYITHDPKYGDYVSAYSHIKDNTGKILSILGVQSGQNSRKSVNEFRNIIFCIQGNYIISYSYCRQGFSSKINKASLSSR